jgi:site-specific recombinase XerD
MYIREAYELFLTEKRISNFTEKTIEFYECAVGRFVTEAGDAEVSETNSLVRVYLGALRERVSPTSVHTYWRGLKTFCRFLHAESFVDEPIRLPTVPLPETTPKAPPSTDVRKTIDALDETTFTGLRNRTIVHLAFDTGMRLQEMRGLDVEDVDLAEGFILVRGKGRKERHVPFGRESKKTLWRYLKQRARRAREAALFLNRSGYRLGYNGYKSVFRRLGLKSVSAHKLRHAFALNYIENGGDGFSLQRILGHTTQQMTGRYVNMAKGSVKRQHDRFAPGDRI